MVFFRIAGKIKWKYHCTGGWNICKCLSFFYSSLLHQELHISQSRNFLLPRWRRGRSSWLSRRGGSWSEPAHARGGWSAPPPRCPSGSSLLPCAPCTFACRALCRPPCQHIDLAFSGIDPQYGSRWHCSTLKSRHRWCSAWLARFGQSRFIKS